MTQRSRDEAYRRMTHEKSEANLRYLAERLSEITDEELEEFVQEAEQTEMPKDIEEQMLAYARGLDCKRQRKERRKALRKYASRVAAVILCVVIIGGVAWVSTDSVSAWKLRFTSLFTQEEQDHISLRPFDHEELADWHGYYLFDEVPEGYELTYAEDYGDEKMVAFSKGENLLLLQQLPSSVTIDVDNEGTMHEFVKVNGKEAHLFTEKEGKDVLSRTLCWMQGDYTLWIESRGDELLGQEVLIALAESLNYVE